jgi:4-hydroxybenzoate polyprenyltransferase
MRLATIIKLCRPRQWYKNLLIFLPLIFGNLLLESRFYPRLLAGFALLCLISSSNYVFNDLIDRERDKNNPEKKDRPIASGEVSFAQGSLLSAGLLFVGMGFALNLGFKFSLVLISLFLLTTIYSLFLKHMVYLDMIAVSSNFILRTIAGHFILGIMLTPWTFICVFLFAFLLSVGKRYSEINFLKKRARSHRTVFDKYNLAALDSLMKISAVAFVTAFTIFTFFSQFSQNLVYLVPLLGYLTFRYTTLVRSGSIIVRHPEFIYLDKKLLFTSTSFVILSITLIYGFF